MKRILLVLFCAIFMTGCQQNNSLEKVGILAPFTGYGAFNGSQIKKGTDLAIEHLLGDSTAYQFIYEDNKTDPTASIAAYRSLKQRGVATFVSVGAPATMAIAHMTNDKNEIMFATLTNSKAFTQVTNRAIRVSPTGESIASKLALYNHDSLGMTRTAVLYINQEQGQEFLEGYRTAFEQAGGTITAAISFEADQRDFKDVINKMVSSNPEGVYVVGVGETLSILLKQLMQEPRAKGIALTGDFNVALPAVVNNLGERTRDITYIDIALDPEFVQLYTAKYNEPANSFGAFGYTIIQLYLMAMENGCKTAAEVHSFLAGHSFYTALSEIAFDEKGEPTFTTVFKKIEKTI